MFRKYQLFLMLLIGVVFSMAVTVNTVHAELSVKIEVKPEINIHKLHVGSELQKIQLTAKANDPALRFVWTDDGPGELIGEKTTIGDYAFIIYQLPDMIDEKSQQTTINVTVSNDAGEQASDSITFTLTDPTLSLQEELSGTIEQLVTIADHYVEIKYWTSPEKTNAFAIYKQVLERDPNNTHAQEKLHEIAQGYKAWGDENYEKLSSYRNRQAAQNDAKTFYERYLLVAQYLLDTLSGFTITEQTLRQLQAEHVPDEIVNNLGNIKDQELHDKEEFLDLLKKTIGRDQTVTHQEVILKYARTLDNSSFQQEFEEVQQKLEELNNPPELSAKLIGELQQVLPQKLEQYKRLREREEQQPEAKENDDIIAIIRDMVEAMEGIEKLTDSPLDQVGQYTQQAETCFERERFTTPPGKNAVELYQDVLALDPANWNARARLYEIAATYREWEQTSRQGRNAEQADIFNKQYELILQELLQNLEEQLDQAENKLTKAQKDGDKREAIVQTLKVLEALRFIRRVYTKFAQETSEMKQFTKNLNQTINSYEQQLLGQTTILQEG